MTRCFVSVAWCSFISALTTTPIVPRSHPSRLVRIATQSDVVAPEKSVWLYASEKISSEWELDCFSRPVLVDGKKLWELLVTDETGQ